MRKYQTFVGFRYLLTRLLNLLSVFIVALCVWALIVVLCVMWGFDHDFRTRIRGALSTITIEDSLNEGIEDWEEVVEEIKDIDGFACAAPYVDGIAVVETGRDPIPVQIKGVDLELEKRVGLVEKYFKDGGKEELSFDFDQEGEYASRKESEPGIVVGKEMCKRRGMQTDMTIQMISPRSRGHWMLSVPTEFTIVGQFYSGWLPYDDGTIYINIDHAQRLLGMGGTVTGLSVEVTDPAMTYDVKEAISEKLGSLCRVQTWEERRRHFLKAVALERRVLGFIIGIVAVLAGFTILVTIWMTVKEKTKDIGILKACGGTVPGIMSIFVLNGFYIGLIGVTLGTGGGLLFLKYVNPISDAVETLTGFTVFPETMYYIAKIPVEYNVSGISWIAGLALAFSVVYAILPAWWAAKLNPVEALRYE